MAGAEVVVLGFETSNNMKVRIALGFKEIPYDFRAIDPADRTEIVSLSGQHLTPVLVHAGRVLFDSAAILRYLEANFRDRPPLFGSSRDEQWEIEDQELFARTTLAAPMMEVVHTRVSGRPVDAAMLERCTRAFAGAAETLVGRLEGREWLVGDAMSAADVTAAAVVCRIRRARTLETPRALDAIAGWVDRVTAYDRHLPPR
jgi:glutathione S-transferase